MGVHHRGYPPSLRGSYTSLRGSYIRKDIKNGTLKNVKIIDNKEIKNILEQRVRKLKNKYEANPSTTNLEALNAGSRDLKHAIRDGEFLIKGTIPKKYINLY